MCFATSIVASVDVARVNEESTLRELRVVGDELGLAVEVHVSPLEEEAPARTVRVTSVDFPIAVAVYSLTREHAGCLVLVMDGGEVPPADWVPLRVATDNDD